MYLTKSQMEATGQGLDVSLNTSLLSRQGELLDKAKYALFDTMDCIKNQSDHVSICVSCVCLSVSS